MKALSPAVLALGALGLTACATQASSPSSSSSGMSQERSSSLPIYSDECITEQEVVNAQKAWGDGIVEIGRIYQNGGDYTAAAADHINRFYAYDYSLVLFKPTLAAVEQFRASFDGALSYFVNGNPSYPEDKGFALNPWSRVRWENAGITNNSCGMAVAMGNYYFTPAGGGDETKVEYTLAYIKDAEGQLRITVHQSSLPYNGS
jgi:hypothetical protein